MPIGEIRGFYRKSGVKKAMFSWIPGLLIFNSLHLAEVLPFILPHRPVFFALETCASVAKWGTCGPPLYVIDTEKRTIHWGPSGIQPTIAPDGKTIFYIEYRHAEKLSETSSVLKSAKIDWKEPRVINRFQPAFVMPTVSADGVQIAGVQY